MKFSKLILTIGIPGSGKSTWVKKYVQKHPLTYVISTDAIRKELTGVEQCINPSQNDMIHDEARKRVKQILDDPNSKGGLGPTIIVDSTNVTCEEWEKYHDLSPSLLLGKMFDITPEQAMKNQSGRERQVPLEIVQMKYDQLQSSKKFIPCFFNMIL